MIRKIVCLSSGVALLAGCSVSTEDQNNSQGKSYGGAGLALTVDVTGKSDVGLFRYDVTPVDCATGAPTGPTTTVTRELEDTTIPGGIETLEDAPLDKGSEHIFADAFITTEPGCYDVTATPLTAEGEPSATCASAFKKGVEVTEKNTTEIFLLSQCQGRDPGSVDAIVAVNHEPEITDVNFPESKFGMCEEARRVCASVTDVDYDPIELVWELASDAPPAAGPAIVSSDYDASTGTLTQCVEYIPEMPGKYDIKLTAYDQVWKDGSLIRVEDWLLAEGYPSESHSEHNFFFYASKCLECEDLLDLMLVQDLSGSFGDDLAVMSDLAPSLFDAVVDGSRGANLGVASYVDKPISPFGGSGDYVYQTELPLTDDKDSFVNAVRGLVLRGGSDIPEGQLEGLMYTALRQAEIGYRDGSRRSIVLTTDAPAHFAGECIASGGCVSPNNGDGVADAGEDYPTVEQVASALIAADAAPIFAVTSDVIPFYTDLVAQLASFGARPGKVVALSRDSSNLVDAILAGLDCEKVTPPGPSEE